MRQCSTANTLTSSMNLFIATCAMSSEDVDKGDGVNRF